MSIARPDGDRHLSLGVERDHATGDRMRSGTKPAEKGWVECAAIADKKHLGPAKLKSEINRRVFGNR